MTRSVILSGGGEYSDPWHPFAETSALLAGLLRGIGFDVEASDDVEDRLADLNGVDLIVANAASGPESAKRAGARDGVLDYLSRGGSVLAVHVGGATLAGIPEWEAVTGMAWVNGRSRHPKTGPSHIITYRDRHPIVRTIDDFDLVDERYSYLRVAADVVPFAAHEFEGATHPLAWARQYGESRVVVDTLAHNALSFESAEHRAMLERSALWLTGGLAD